MVTGKGAPSFSTVISAPSDLPRATQGASAPGPLEWAAACLLAGLVAACGTTTEPPDPPPPPPPGAADLALEPVAEGLDSPLHLTAPRGDPRLFVVEQPGRIRIVADGALLETPFLDLTSQVVSGGERGLLSVAFHPDYATNGRFFVNYTGAGGDTRVEEYQVSGDPAVADPASARLLLQIEQPFSNHNGGLLAFGPDDMLYVGTGDGGGAGDPGEHGQDTATLLGALLRLDVDGEEPYAVPPDNPLVGEEGARPELWAWGLRNPWRFAFDPPDGRLYIADVGQNRWEEVNAEPAEAAGLNYGWNVMEGEECFEADTCDTTGLTLPVLTYATGVEGCAIIGGHVYRGDALPDLQGLYFYSDFCSGWLRSFRLQNGEAVDRVEWEVGNVGMVRSMGEDAAGELYLLAADGTVYRLAPADPE